MENVYQVITAKGWNEWNNFLESLGYSNYCETINAKNFEIPQSRVRTFMVSILGDYNYKFNKNIGLKYRLKDLLEKEVDEKYYLSDKMINYISQTGSLNFANKDAKINLEVARPLTTDQNKRAGTTYDTKKILCNELVKSNILSEYGVVNHSRTNGLHDKNKKTRQTDYIETKYIRLKRNTKQLRETIENNEFKIGEIKMLDLYNRTTRENISQTIDTGHNSQRLFDGLRIRKLTPKECFRLMGVKEEDYNNVSKNQSNSSLYHLVGDSIVTTCLMMIFGELFNVDYISKIKTLVEEIKEK